MREYLPTGRKSLSKETKLGLKSIKTTVGSWLATLKSSWQPIFQFDRSQITAFQAIRCAFGMALPLALGVVTGQVITGAAIASGALLLGSIGLKDTAQTRARGMLLASLFITLSAFVGGITGGIGWLPVFVIGIWGVVAGMFASLSRVAQVVGVQSCAALVIYAHLELDPLHALITAGLVCAGALFQALLASIPSAWTNTAPERSALAAIYQKLADYAANPFSQQGAFMVSDALLAGHTTLLNSNTRTEQGQMFARLLENAEHLRLMLFVLISLRQQLREREAEQEEESAGACLDQLFRASGDELQNIALALKAASPLVESRSSRPFEEIKKSLAELRRVAKVSDYKDEIHRHLRYCTALLGELHIARRLATSWRQARQYWPRHIRFPYPRPPRLHLEDAWANIRANLTPHSSTFRHAMRLGLTLALATALYQIFHMPLTRGYWIPMTAALVLRSDFITTFTRGIARLLGTMLGAVLTTLLVVFLAPSQPLLVVIVTLMGYLMFATLFANYTIFSAATTIVAVCLLSFMHVPTLETAASRAIDTAIGGLLALLIYALWPTWERSQVPENIAKRLEMLGRYFDAVMQAYADPAIQQLDVVDKRHMESRLARSNALGSVQRSLQEPAAHRVNADLAEGLLGAADNIARNMLALEAYLFDNPRHDTLSEITLFSAAVDEALGQLVAAVRTGQPATALPDMHAALQALKAAIKTKKQAPDWAQAQWRFVVEEAKRIVANIRAMQQLLSTGSFV